MEDFRPNDSEHAIRSNQTHSAFQRYYTTRLMQQLLSSKQDSKYYDFVDFDITSVTTPEQIAELDKKLAEIVQSPEIQSELERLEGDKDFEKAFYGKLREEVAIEIKKDSDRIENAHKVFVALETGNLDEILQDPETQKWSEEVYSADKEKRKEAFKSYIHDILTSDDPKLDEMCWIKTIENMDDNSLSGKSGYPDLDKPITTRMAILSRLTGQPYEIQRKGSYGPMYAYYSHYENEIISGEDMTPEQRQQAESARSELESQKGQQAKYQKGKVFISGYAVGDDKDIRDIATSGVEKGEFFSVEIDISRDELLARGINPDEIGWKSLEQIREEQLHQDVRETLLNGDSEIGFAKTINSYEESNRGDYEGKPPVTNRAMPHNLYDLGKRFGIGFPSDVITVSGNYEPQELTYSNTFSTSSTTENEKKEISKRENAIAKLRQAIDKDNTGKYDRKGIVYLPRYATNDGSINYLGQPFAKVEEVLEIEVTQRELAEAGILPDDFKWVEKAKISAKDIAEADREQALTTTEVGGFKGFMKKLLDKFKGIGEK